MCFKFIIGGACGLFGECSDDLTHCVCEKGWRRSTEMIYFPYVKKNFPILSEDEFLLDHRDNETLIEDFLPCSENDNILRTLFILSFISCSLAFYFYARMIKTKRHLLRTGPLLLSLFSFATLSLVRIVDIDREYGKDFTFTFWLSVYLTLQNLGTTVFISRFISYHMKKIRINFGGDVKVFGKNMLAWLNKQIPMLTGFDLLFFSMFLAPVFVDAQTGAYLVYAAVLLQALRTAHFMILTYVVIRGIVSDMKAFVESCNNLFSEKTEFQIYCEKTIPKLNGIMLGAFVFCIYAFIPFFAFLTSPGFQPVFRYFWASTGVVWSIVSVVITYKFSSSRKKTISAYQKTSNQVAVTSQTPASNPSNI